MRVLVTGASGLIGRAVTTLLEGRGDDVRHWDIARGDLSGPAWAHVAVKGVDAVIHLAGRRAAVAAQEQQGFALLAGNLGIDLAVLTEAAAAGVRRLVYASTVSVYATSAPRGMDAWGTRRFKEEHADAFPDGSVRFSAWGKLTAERLIEAALVRHPGFHWAVVRLVNTYGPHDDFGPDALVIPALIRKAAEGDFAVEGADNERDFLYVDDAARGIVAALDVDTAGTWNLGTGVGVKIGDVARMVVEAWGTRARWLETVSGTTGAVCKVVDPSKAASDLAWAAEVSIGEGIRRTVEWYRAQIAPKGQP